MKCSECNTKISLENSVCPLCGIKIKCKIYRNSPKFIISIIIPTVIISSIGVFLIFGVNILSWTSVLLISLFTTGWGILSYLIKFSLDEYGISYHHPFKQTVNMKWDEIDEFTVYKENERKSIFPKKIYTLTSIKSDKTIAFHEMKHSMEGYCRFIAAIIARTKKYPENKHHKN